MQVGFMTATSESQRAGTLMGRLRGAGTTYLEGSTTWKEYGTSNVFSTHASVDDFSENPPYDRLPRRVGVIEVALHSFSA